MRNSIFVRAAGALAAFAAIGLLATHGVVAPALAGPPPKLEFGIGVGFALRAFTFTPAEPKPYICNIAPSISGFSTHMHPGNFAIIQSANGHFIGTEDANQQIGGFSDSFATVADLKAALADPGGWTISITDGETGVQYTFAMSVDASSLTADYLRPIIFTNLMPGDSIGRNPTFTWTQAPTSNPDAQPDLVFNQLYSDDFANIYNAPPVGINDTSWTPDGPLAYNTYTVFVSKLKSSPNQSLVAATLDPTFPPGATGYLTPFVTTGAISYVPQLKVLCLGDLTGDAQRNTADLTRFLGQFGRTCAEITGTCADFNNDGVVNTADLTFFLGRFGSSCV
ncbi:MAG: hypothetical protein ACKVZJ_01775 [Phycisphaerales bacterium]